MSREIKFRYRLQSVETKEVIVKIFAIEEIENHDFSVWHENYNILSRDQNTNLKDKNGKEIYEGDILKGEEEGVVQVIWNDKSACFGIHGSGMANFLSQHNLKTEVIGNIHENPELLKV